MAPALACSTSFRRISWPAMTPSRTRPADLTRWQQQGLTRSKRGWDLIFGQQVCLLLFGESLESRFVALTRAARQPCQNGGSRSKMPKIVWASTTTTQPSKTFRRRLYSTDSVDLLVAACMCAASVLLLGCNADSNEHSKSCDQGNRRMSKRGMRALRCTLRA